MSVFTYTMFFSLCLGIILAIVLLTSKYYQSKANNWLAFALIVTSATCILDIWSENYSGTSELASFFLYDIELQLLIYPPLYFYFKISTSDSQIRNRVVAYLFLPFFIDTLINIAIVSYYPIEEIIESQTIQIFYVCETILGLIFNFFLCYKAYHMVKNEKNNPTQQSWIYKMWLSTFALLVMWMLMTVLIYTVDIDISMIVSTFYTVVFLWFYAIIYSGIVNLNLMNNREDIKLKLQEKVINLNQPLIESQLSDSKPSNSSEKVAGHFEKLKRLMEEENLYRNENLSIDDIAQELGMSSGYISQIIKKIANKNFPIWVNEFRVSDSKKMLLDKDFDQYTIVAIGYEAGFKSKSAFYTNFKQITGLTPANFRKMKS